MNPPVPFAVVACAACLAAGVALLLGRMAATDATVLAGNIECCCCQGLLLLASYPATDLQDAFTMTVRACTLQGMVQGQPWLWRRFCKHAALSTAEPLLRYCRWLMSVTGCRTFQQSHPASSCIRHWCHLLLHRTYLKPPELVHLILHATALADLAQPYVGQACLACRKHTA
jgi:hypothetical protein